MHIDCFDAPDDSQYCSLPRPKTSPSRMAIVGVMSSTLPFFVLSDDSRVAMEL